VKNSGRWILLLLVVVELLYVVSANLFISSGSLQKLINKPNDTAIAFKNSWTLIPGMVHVEKFMLRDQDKNVQWQFEVDHTVMFINIFSLMNRTLDIVEAEAEGARFRLKLQKAKDDPHAPPIEGFEGPPHVSTKPPTKRWRFDISNLKLRSFNEIWIHHYHFTGDAKARANFFIWPRNHFEVQPSELIIESGVLNVAGQDVIEGVKGFFSGHVEEFPIGIKKGREVIDHLSGKAVFSGEVERPNILNMYIRSVDWIHFEKIRGRIDADLKIEDGAFAAPTSLKIQAKEIVTKISTLLVKGSGTIQLSKPHGTAPSELRVHADRFQFADPANDKTVMSGSGLDILARTDSDHLLEAFKKVRLKIELPPTEATDLDYFNRFIPEYSDLKIEKGRASLKGFLNVDSQGPSEDSLVTLKAEGVNVQYGKTLMSGNLLINAHLKDAEEKADVFDISNTEITFDDVYSEETEFDWLGRRAPWVGQLKIKQARWFPRGDPVFAGDVAMTLSDLRPILEVYSVKKRMAPWIRSVLNLKNVESTAHLTIGKKSTFLDRVEIDSDGLDLKGWLKVAKDYKKGAVLADLGLLTVGVDVREKSTKVRLTGARKWFDEEQQKKTNE
jgi:hypothetical protein